MEIWKDIENFEGLYQVSNYGRIKSLPKEHKNRWGTYITKEKILNGKIDNNGYVMVVLCKNKKYKYQRIHRIVAEAFIENKDNLPIINHKDENKRNNNVNNLEWCDYLYNNNYGKKNDNLKKKISQYTLKNEFIKDYNSIMEASRENNINHSNIISVLKGKRNKAGNYLWKYKI